MFYQRESFPSKAYLFPDCLGKVNGFNTIYFLKL